MDRHNCNPKKEILNQPDYVLELWYGKAGLFFISKLREINIIEENSIGNINYFGDNNKWLLYYDTETDIFWINYEDIWSILSSEYQLNHQQIRDLTKVILEQVTNCKVVTTNALCAKSFEKLEQVTNCKVVTTSFVLVVYDIELEQVTNCNIITTKNKIY
jgi:hypothetical protein